MEFDIRLPEVEDRAFPYWVTALVVVILAVVLIQISGLRHHRDSGADIRRQRALISADFYVKCRIAWPNESFTASTFKILKQALPLPGAHRRLGVFKQFLGQQGLSELKRIDSPAAIRGRHLTKHQIAKLHREKAMWLRIYGPQKITHEDARRYAGQIRKLNLGPLREVAAAQVYRRAGLKGEADQTMNKARVNSMMQVAGVSLLIGLLGVGGIGGLVVAGFFLSNAGRTLTTPVPLTLLKPSSLIAAFIIYLTIYIGIGAAAEVFGDAVDASGAIYMSVVIASALVAFLIGLGALQNRLRPGQDWREIGFRTMAAGRDIAWGAAGYLASLPFLLIALMVTMLLTRTVFKNFETPQQPFGDIASRGGALEIFLVFFAATVVAPVVEETFFRGLLYTAFRGKLRVWPSVVMVSAMFAVIHPLPGGFLPIFTLACVLALLRERSGSLLPGMVCHGLFNAISLILSMLVA